MNNNKSNIKVKAGVLCIVWLLLAVLFSGFVLGGTVTNTDVSTTTTDSDMVINYQDGTIKFLSQFMVNGTTPRRINDSYDNVDTLIRNSKGNYWAATGANIQLAIDDLDNGTVYFPTDTFIITAKLTGNSDVDLIGSGSGTIFKLGDSVDDDILYIDDISNMVISNIMFDGNNEGNTGAAGTNCIDIQGTSNNITIQNCWFNHGCGNMVSIGLEPSNVIVEDSFFFNISHVNYSSAVLIQGDNCIVKNNFIKDTFACGVIVEGSEANPASFNIIDGNIITGDIGHGIHCEDAKSDNVTIINNHIYDLNSTAYVVSASHWSKGITSDAIDTVCSNNVISGVQLAGISVKNGIVSNNIVTDIEEDGIISSSSGKTIIDGNIVKRAGDNSIQVAHGDNAYSTISNNEIYDSGDEGIQCYGNVTISNNYVENSGRTGISVLAASGRKIAVIIGNTIKNSGLALSNSYGINVDGTGAGVICNNNFIDGVYGTYPSGTGIRFYSKNGTCNGNFISNAILYGIWFNDANVEVTCIGNFFDNIGDDGIRTIAGVHGLISGNYFSSTCSDTIDDRSGGTITIKDNIGYTTESSGECHIDAGSDSVVVDHNMSLAPTCPIQITPASNLTASAITCFWTDTYTATQFTLHVNKDAVATIYFGWDSKAT